MTNALDTGDDQDHDEPLTQPSALELTRRATRQQHSDTREQLLELVNDALGAKLGHDVGRLEVALGHLHQLAANAHTLAAAVAVEQTTINAGDTA